MDHPRDEDQWTFTPESGASYRGPCLSDFARRGLLGGGADKEVGRRRSHRREGRYLAARARGNVPHHPVARFCVERWGRESAPATVRVDDPPPGRERQVNFGLLGLVLLPTSPPDVRKNTVAMLETGGLRSYCFSTHTTTSTRSLSCRRWARSILSLMRATALRSESFVVCMWQINLRGFGSPASGYRSGSPPGFRPCPAPTS
jgi:hypothetical protein